MKGIINGKILLEDENGRFAPQERMVLLFDEKIIQAAPANYFAASQVEELIDAQGLYVSPGFINSHIHGCAGADTMDEDDDALQKIAEYQATTGVTSFCPTTMTYDMPRVHRALERIRKAMKETPENGARVLGAHLEGPFINPDYKGAQAPENIVAPDFKLIETYADAIRIVTAAPEMIPAGCSFPADCRRAGIRLSAGHSGADYETMVKAIQEQDFSRCTHLFNAMSGLHHRNPGVAAAAMDNGYLWCELIADNIHVVPAMQRIAFRMKGLEKLVAITDSMRACGLPDGESELGGQKVYKKDGRAVLADGTIAGSVLTMNEAVRNLAENLGIPVWQAAECATISAARSMGMQYQAGSFEAGAAADIVFFDDDVNIYRTIVNGKTVYEG